MKTIKAGIIGTGFIGPAHVEAVRRLGFVEMSALCEANEALAATKAAQLGIPKSYGSVEALLADPEIDVVHNCTPNHLHFDISRKIMAADKHVISEKPLAMTTAESKQLVKLAAKSGVVNAIDFNYRYYPLVQEARDMVASGKLGDVFHANGSYTQDWLFLPTDWNWRLVPGFSGKSRAIADIGSHWCDCIQFITGLRITRVMADLRTIHKNRMKPKKEVETYSGKMLTAADYEAVKITTEDYANVLFEFDNGAFGSFSVSQCFAGRKNRLFYELAGSKRAVTWDQERPNELWIGYREKANEVLIKDPSLLSPRARAYAHYPGGHPEAYPDGLKNFMLRVYSYLAGKTKEADFSTFQDGHNELAICEAILASSAAKKWTAVKY
ncbi:MAG TPA: Gfo/Idh/MocA family oxidoreductase [Verrucomicrobiae bacterium]|jgi:predicted dehydrogenase|nr:Gfo/Idh/MocA family oxidoreductase [Verrucomicrobiae bacterium]